MSGDVAATWEPVESLVEWPGNPRVNDHAVDDVAASIQRWGFGAPIVARAADRMVIAGHTRLKAARRLGLAKVPVRFLDLSDAEARALALADNRIGELADWDDAALHEALRALGQEDVDLSGLGWSDVELASLLAEGRPPAGGGVEPEPPPPLPGAATVTCARCEDHLRAQSDHAYDAVVCDPPYGLSESLSPAEVRDLLACWTAEPPVPWRGRDRGFMGREWDAFVPGPDVWREVLRTCKPGAHLVAFAGTRTVGWLQLALQLAGWEVRDQGAWCYWSGFPKSLDVSKAIDEAMGAEREVVGSIPMPGHQLDEMGAGRWTGRLLGGPTTPEARAWSGWGTALKPAIEPFVLARRPLEGTVAQNVLRWGTGGLNVDGTRFRPGDPMWPGPDDGELTETGARPRSPSATSYELPPRDAYQTEGQRIGRWPANLVHCSKPSRREREAGCAHLPETISAAVELHGEGSSALRSPRAGAGRGEVGTTLRNNHPTLKPIRLMAWLARLVTPPGGRVLDPFAGSGTVGCAAVPQGFAYDGIEVDESYCRIAEARIAHWSAVGLGDLASWDEPEDPEDG